MKLEYFIKKRKIFNLKSGNVENKYIVALLPKSRITNETICKKVEVGCTLSSAETALAMDEISNVILFICLKIMFKIHGFMFQSGKFMFHTRQSVKQIVLCGMHI